MYGYESHVAVKIVVMKQTRGFYASGGTGASTFADKVLPVGRSLLNLSSCKSRNCHIHGFILTDVALISVPIMYESMEGLCVEITDKDRNCVILRAKCFCNLTSKRFDHSKLYD